MASCIFGNSNYAFCIFFGKLEQGLVSGLELVWH